MPTSSKPSSGETVNDTGAATSMRSEKDLNQGKKGGRKRANGIVAREKILDAAALIASERGYEGTSISLVSARSGLPASSIYWHFKNKDDLIAAVIDRSFSRWLAALRDRPMPNDVTSIEAFVAFQTGQVIRALKQAPDFLRLGLMLGLERHPEDPTARKMFLNVRAQAYQNAMKSYGEWLPDFDDEALAQLASFIVSMGDGYFISREVADVTQDLMDQQDLLVASILGVINHLSTQMRNAE